MATITFKKSAFKDAHDILLEVTELDKNGKSPNAFAYYGKHLSIIIEPNETESKNTLWGIYDITITSTLWNENKLKSNFIK